MKTLWLVITLCLIGTSADAQFLPVHGSASTAPVTLVEIGSGYTLVNNGSTASNVPVRFGYGFARGDMPLGNTIVCKDESGNIYPCQVDELSTRTGMPGATDTPGWLHATISLLYTPSWTASATHTFHIFKTSGTYSAGTGLPTSALTTTHQYQVRYQNVKLANGTTYGSGSYTCDLNKAIAAGPIAGVGVGSGVDGGGGGYQIIENGAVETTIEALAPAENGTTPDGQIMCKFYAMLWQDPASPGTLGQVELAAWIGQPWQNTGASIGFNWGDVSLYDATTSTTLRNYSVGTSFAPADVIPDPINWNRNGGGDSGSPLIHQYTAVCGSISGVADYCANGGGFGVTLNVSGSTLTIAGGSIGWNFYGSVFNNAYIYVGSGNTGCTAGAYHVTSAISANAFTINLTNTTGGSLGGGCSAITNFQFGSGFIHNYGGLQTGAPITFSVSNGTLPTPLNSTTLYFAASAPSLSTINQVSDFSVWGTPQTAGFAQYTSYPWTEGIGVFDGGTCNAGGSCFTVTRHAALYPWSGMYLMADDNAHPFWIAGSKSQNVANLYPHLSNPQKTYWESTALVPPYYLTAPNLSVPPATPITFFNNNASNTGGPLYQGASVGPQETAINPGGSHVGIGNMTGFAANWFLDPNQTQANWDLLENDALTNTNTPGGAILNAETGWPTTYDCGVYPTCSAYPTLTKSGVSPGAHENDVFYWLNTNDSFNSGFTSFTSPVGLPTLNVAADAYWWLGGPYYDISQRSNDWPSHYADWGDPMAYMIMGQPWVLRQMQSWANLMAVAFPTSNGTNCVSCRDFVVNGVHYWGKVSTGYQDPRGSAWALREAMFSGVLGADNDPVKNYHWNWYKENIDALYAWVHLYYGQNINNVSGGVADPNMEAMGYITSQNWTSDPWQTGYEAGILQQGYGLTHYTSSVLAGASALWAANVGITLQTQEWYYQTLNQDAAGHTMSTYWSAPYIALYQASHNGDQSIPGKNPTAADASGIFIASPLEGYTDTVLSSSGVACVDPGTSYDPTWQGLVHNGDEMFTDDLTDNGAAWAIFGANTLYFVINVNPSDSNCSNHASFQLTTTNPKTQACSSTTGSTGCPSSYTPAGGWPSNGCTAYNPYSECNFDWRPQANPSSGQAGYASGATGYSAYIEAALQEAVDYGVTLPHVADALSNELARNPISSYSYANGASKSNPGAQWQMWLMGPTTIPSPPPSAQTIASITANPSPGGCLNSTVGALCTTVSVTMSNSNSPTFAAAGGTVALVASGTGSNSSCSGGDTTNFLIGSTTGAITLKNTGITQQTYNLCVAATTGASYVTNSPFYQQIQIVISSQIISTISQSPNPGTCTTGATNTCTTVSVVMSPASPTFVTGNGGGSGTLSLVASGGSCSSIDSSYATDFSIGSTSGVISILNTGIAAGNYNLCARASTSATGVGNSPQYLPVSITVNPSGGGIKTIVSSNQRCNADSTSQVTTTCAMTVSTAGNLVAFGYTTCAPSNCGTGSALPQITAITYGAGSSGGSGGTCTPGVATGTQSSGSGMTAGAAWVLCRNVTSSGTVTFTFTWNGGGANYSTVYPIEISGASSTIPDMGVGNVGYVASGTSSVSTNGNVTQSNALVLDVCISPTSGTPNFGGSQTALNGGTIDGVGTAAGKLTTSPANGTSPTLTCTASQSSFSLAHSVVAIQ